MDCIMMLRDEPNFDHAVEMLQNCIRLCQNVPGIIQGNLTDINFLKNTVKGFPKQYRCLVKSNESVSQELVKKLCGDHITNQGFKESMQKCVKIFHTTLIPKRSNP
ncbi:uncharacterized protein LOC126896124 isoform X2 [Daktulosphaira vitifoliae]|nr:uncharacterized protein LOC126896124 isoform X2 [Daktulosphaira vitifoliae]XP_050524574.1 uncharacterized protein LOC126896124 isoform X2 [Daktulosphaira vitifoliae]